LSGAGAYGKFALLFHARGKPISGIVARRYSSISPNALLTVFALLAAAAIGIGIVFAALGAWLILPFAGAEALALAIAFVATVRRAAHDEGTGR
jgi:uncharacterized membrane protein